MDRLDRDDPYVDDAGQDRERDQRQSDTAGNEQIFTVSRFYRRFGRFRDRVS